MNQIAFDNGNKTRVENEWIVAAKIKTIKYLSMYS